MTVRAACLGFAAPPVALRQLVAEGFTSVRVLPLLCTPGHHPTRDVPQAIAASGIADILAVTVEPALVCDDPGIRSFRLRALTARLVESGFEVWGLDGLVVPQDLGTAHGVLAVGAFGSSPGLRPVQALEALRAKGVRRPVVASLFLAPDRLPDAVSASCASVSVVDPLGAPPAFVDLLVAQARVRCPTADLTSWAA